MTFLLAGLASSPSNSSTISNVEPGLLGFLVVAALGIALVFLLRSMNKQFRKIGPKPEEAESAVVGEAEDVDGDGDGGGVGRTEATVEPHDAKRS